MADAVATAGLLPSVSHERVRNIVAGPFEGLEYRDAVEHGEALDAVGVVEGGLTRVQTALGEAVALARVTDRQRPGSVFMPMHWTDSQCSQGTVNRLIAPVVDPLSGQPMFKQGRVQARAQLTVTRPLTAALVVSVALLPRAASSRASAWLAVWARTA